MELFHKVIQQQVLHTEIGTFATTTLAVSKGKWYAEMKCNTYGSYLCWFK
jgi:hypothetical protein